MICLLLLLLPLVDARLRGVKAQDCGQQPSEKPEVFRDGFDELELFQQDLAMSSDVNRKSTVEWLAHFTDHKSKISSGERVLNIETVAGQLSKVLSKVNSGSCADDPMWRDADGDGCEIYKFAIESGKVTLDSACNGGGGVDLPARGLRGGRLQVVADATAKAFCPVTCGVCPPTPDVFTAYKDDAVVGVGGLDDVDFLQVGVSSSTGVAKKSVKSWEEHLHDHESRITSEQRVVDNETVAFKLSQLQKGEGCADDPMWRDADGDGCEIYKFAIESGKTTREVACSGGGENPPSRGLRGALVQVVADATARVFCPITCGVC